MKIRRKWTARMMILVCVKTPCAIKGDKCYDCKSPERICRGLSVLWGKPMTGEFEVILIDEELGY